MRRFTLAGLASLAVFAAQATPVNLVVNGDFETGTFAGWTKSGNPSLSDVIANTVTSNTTFVWRVGATGSPAVISQSLGTVVGELYTLEFDFFSNATNVNSTAFSANFGGTTVFSTAGVAFNWVSFSFSGLQASSVATTLSFSGRNDPSFYRLDNVRVTSQNTVTNVPEPTSLALAVLALGVMVQHTRKARA